MIKTKNIVMLILSTILTINIMTISAFASTGGSFGSPLPECDNIIFIPLVNDNDSCIQFTDFESACSSVLDNNLYKYLGVYSDGSTQTFDTTPYETWFSSNSDYEIIKYVGYANGLYYYNCLFYNPEEVTFYSDVSVSRIYYKLNEGVSSSRLITNSFESVQSISSNGIPYHFWSYCNLGLFDLSKTSNQTFCYVTNFSDGIQFYSTKDILNTNGDVVHKGEDVSRLVFNVETINQSILSVDLKIEASENYDNSLNGRYYWKIFEEFKEDDNDDIVADGVMVYHHKNYFWFTDDTHKQMLSSTHLLTLDNAMHSSIYINSLFNGSIANLKYDTNYEIVVFKLEWNGEQYVEIQTDFNAILLFKEGSFVAPDIEVNGNVSFDENTGGIIYNYNGYDGKYSNTDVDFNGAIDDFEKITNTEWSPNLMSGLTVVRGLFDDIIDSLGLVDIIMIILTLGLVGWFLGRKMRG